MTKYCRESPNSDSGSGNLSLRLSAESSGELSESELGKRLENLTMPPERAKLRCMMNLRYIHRCMTDRRRVELDDGRFGKIVRVDTEFPSNHTTVSVWTETSMGPGVTKVDIRRIVGPLPESKAPPSAESA